MVSAAVVVGREVVGGGVRMIVWLQLQAAGGSGFFSFLCFAFLACLFVCWLLASDAICPLPSEMA